MSVEKRRPLETRRHKALRRTAIFTAILALLCLLDGYRILPGHAIRYTEEDYHTGRTEPVTWLVPPGELNMRTGLFCLSGSDNALLLGGVRFYPMYGWMNCGSSVMDCTSPAPIHAGAWMVSRRTGRKVLDEKTQEETWQYSRAKYFFGRVDDPAVDSVRVRLCRRDYETDQYRGVTDYQIDGEAMLQRDGRRYFACPFDLDEQAFQEQYNSPAYYFCDALDREGNVLYTQDQEDMAVTWSSIG